MGIYNHNLVDVPKSISLGKIPYINIQNAITKICLAMNLMAVKEFDLKPSSSDSNDSSNLFDPYAQSYCDKNFPTTKISASWATNIVENPKQNIFDYLTLVASTPVIDLSF